MKITHENIEEVLFMYHEGDLSNEQKAELMEYLYQNPEYYKEFSLWAQVRLSDQKLPIPYFAAALKQKPIFWQLSSWKSLGLVSILALSGLILIWMFSSQEKKKEQEILQSSEKKTISPFYFKEASYPAKIPSPKRTSNTNSNTLVNPSSSSMEPAVDSTNTSEYKQIDSLSISSEAKGAEIKIEEVPKEVVHVSMVEQTMPSSISGLSAKPALKRKPIQKMSLKPTSDILPTNSNF